MWAKWERLHDVQHDVHEMPWEARPALSGAIQSMWAVDVQWDRFREAHERNFAFWPHPFPHYQWVVEAHFLLVAARNARRRLNVWRESLGDLKLSPELDESIDALLDAWDQLRNDHEHFDERVPGGPRENRGRITQSNWLVHYETEPAEPGQGVWSANNLREGRYFSFGETEVDLLAIREAIVRVADELRLWLEANGHWSNKRITLSPYVLRGEEIKLPADTVCPECGGPLTNVEQVQMNGHRYMFVTLACAQGHTWEVEGGQYHPTRPQPFPLPEQPAPGK